MDHGGEEGPDGDRQGVGRRQNRPGRALERELEVCETQLLELSACARARGALSRANVAS